MKTSYTKASGQSSRLSPLCLLAYRTLVIKSAFQTKGFKNNFSHYKDVFSRHILIILTLRGSGRKMEKWKPIKTEIWDCVSSTHIQSERERQRERDKEIYIERMKRTQLSNQKTNKTSEQMKKNKYTHIIQTWLTTQYLIVLLKRYKTTKKLNIFTKHQWWII